MARTALDSTRGATAALVTVALAVALLLAMAGPATAHEERESFFPPGNGSEPTYRPIGKAAAVRVVCKRDSGKRISRIRDAKLRAFNRSLLSRCRHRHIQAAVNSVRKQRTNIYVLPGVYRERPSWNPPCTKNYDGGVVSYRQIVRCGEIVNLVTIAGDDPGDDDRVCDNALCKLQIEGTGARPGQVLLKGGFRRNGDWVKHNGLKADRADGFYLKNMAFELFRENAVYVHETDGYHLDKVVARKNDLYGILTFTSDHGVIRRCHTYYNGDSGVYPGSAADVNADSKVTGPLQRWAVRISQCNTHHNALGFSGTAGNSVYFRNNRVHNNGAGYVTDSFVGGHPGMPQDHAWLQGNRIYSNNKNYYPNVQPGGPCREPKPVDRGFQRGTVCPAFPVPVGTGVLIAGGNHNYVRRNHIYDNWRSGVMLFWVPAAVRGDIDVLKQNDTSNHNAFVGNTMGVTPQGGPKPNGTDFWWDDGGVGNCWQGNTAAPGRNITHNALLPTGLPNCAAGSQLPVSNVVKSVQLLPCASFNRESNPAPIGCDWMKSPRKPGARAADPSPAAVSTAGDGLAVAALSLLAMLSLALVVRRRVRLV